MLVLAGAAGLAQPRVHFAHAAREHISSTYAPAWEKLFLREGVDASYPMPAASEVLDLISPLKDVAGMGAFSLSQESDDGQPGLYPVGVDALSFLAPPYLVYNDNSGVSLVIEEGDVDVWFPAATGDRVCVVMLDQRVASSRAQCAVVP